jgi:hypothetical protein
MMNQNKLPWTPEEIIATVLAEIEPQEPGKMSIKPVALCAFAQLALGKPNGRASPSVEHELLQRIGRVLNAVERGDDPVAAYDRPLPADKPLRPRDQLDTAYRRDAEMMNAIDAGLRKGMPIGPALILGALRGEIDAG